jgi:transposase
VVQAWAKRAGVRFVQLPPRSPELNPIEKLWGHLKDYVAAQQPANDDELDAAVLRFWGGLSVPLINQYIDHQFRNIKAIIKAKGDHIRK